MRQSGQTYDEQGYDEFDIPRATASFRVPRKRAGMDRTTRNMVMVAGGIALLMILGVGVQALLRPHGLPVVAAQKGPWREKPVNPGGMHVLGEGNAIYGGTHTTGQDQVMPGPEKPDLAALRRDEQKPAPAASAQATPAKSAPALAAPARADAQPLAAPVPAATTGAAPSLADAAPRLPIPPVPTAPPPLAAAPAGASIAAAVRTPAPQTPAGPAAGSASLAAVVNGGPQVQLAALQSEAAARAEWSMLVAKMPSLLGGRSPQIAKAVVNGQTWYRLRTGGFDSVAAAQDFCTQVRAQGGACAADRS